VQSDGDSESTAPVAEFDLSEEVLHEIEGLMQGAVPVGDSSPEGM
jgi:hypothetical protein